MSAIESEKAKKSLVKSLYSRLFQKLVHALNSPFVMSAPMNFVGVVDIAGFGDFI